MSKNETTTSGVSFCGLLCIVFIVLKLCGVIAWPWVWVLSPLWIGFLLGVVLIIVGLFITLVTTK